MLICNKRGLRLAWYGVRRTLVVCVALGALACAPPDSDGDAAADAFPDWLDALTAQISADRLTDPPSQILTYRYRGQTVFYRPPYCCDIPGVLYDASGAVLCYPTGGFSGRGDGQCEDFLRLRSDCTLRWRDARAKQNATDACARERSGRPLR